jgi:hypothetical protein
MSIAKYLVALTLLQSINVFADSTCVECQEKRSNSLDGALGSSAIDSLGTTANKMAGQVSSKESYQQSVCHKYELAQDKVDVKNIFKYVESSPYASNQLDFWTNPACQLSSKNDTPGTIIFNTANNTVKNENFPKVVHDILVDKKHSPETWLKAINTTTSDGYTFLDYIQYKYNNGDYDRSEYNEAAKRIITYVCQNGGVYSKFKESAKCP